MSGDITSLERHTPKLYTGQTFEDWKRSVKLQIDAKEGLAASNPTLGPAVAMTPEQLYDYDKKITPLGHDPVGFYSCGELEYLEAREAKERFVKAMKSIGGEIW